MCVFMCVCVCVCVFIFVSSFGVCYDDFFVGHDVVL